MGKPVVHFEILGPGGPGLRSFYGELFDWKFQTMEGMDYGTVDASDSGIGGGIGESQSGNPMVTVYIQVDDLQAYLDKVEQLGGKTVMPPMEIPNIVTFAQFADPDGNIIGLVKA